MNFFLFTQIFPLGLFTQECMTLFLIDNLKNSNVLLSVLQDLRSFHSMNEYIPFAITAVTKSETPLITKTCMATPTALIIHSWFCWWVDQQGHLCLWFRLKNFGVTNLFNFQWFSKLFEEERRAYINRHTAMIVQFRTEIH